ncbi:MAG: DUF2232 domain-containing protein [Candidatus Eisenbacteria bacterium]|uniref:DUF2232 domain-containing protein n=1 Tax=Eiseniibacteriota bacterium TaxID=2212470 RepID=A0A849SRF9_UNCEI|nr:DUF2232 domain-containing protein [Candidatus Eisenbacteria bacterium]
MISTAELGRSRGAGWRAVFIVAGLAAGAWATPSPWGWLWLLVPLVVAASLLLCWRFGVWGVVTPVALQVGSMLASGPANPWLWWVPVTALSGAWMGLREEGGGPGSGHRAWMLLPLLVLAAALPWTPGYPTLVSRMQSMLDEGSRQRVEMLRQMGYDGERLQTAQHLGEESDALVRRALPFALPSLMFLWVAMLVTAGRVIAGRAAAWIRWPPLSDHPFANWRLPDGALWLFLAGLGLVLLGRPELMPTAWTLLAVPGIGFCLQGVAVVESLLLARGVPHAIIALTLLFVFVMALPVFLMTSACLGLSDVWLDFRRLESDVEAEPS